MALPKGPGETWGFALKGMEMFEEKQKELSDNDIKKLLMKQFKSFGMKEDDITQELIDMKKDELKVKDKTKSILKAYNSFKRKK